MPLPTPTLRTARLLLRPFTPADTDAIYALQSNPRVLRYWDSPPWKERARADRFIAVCRQMEQEGTGARLAIERAADGAFIGWCCLIHWNPDYRSASMGYCLDDAVWGHGFATEAAGALLQWAFDTLDLNRVQAETDTRNTASSRVLEKLGFVREAPSEKTASWMATCRIPGCTGCSGGNGSRCSHLRRRTEAVVRQSDTSDRLGSAAPTCAGNIPCRLKRTFNGDTQ
jgi:[ribosomal protein S5]-alanine N-acetyltransferase